MQTFGEQLVSARKAKGMTQEALAQAAAITRQTISSWERGRTIPDIESVRRLSDILDVDFLQAAEAQGAAPDFEPSAEVKSAPVEERAASAAGRRPIRKWWIAAGAAALVCVVLLTFLLLPRRSAPAGGEDTYNADFFRQETPNEPGRPYLTFNNAQWEESGENQTFTRYAFRMYEQNGKSFTISRIKVQAESGKSGAVRTADYGPSDLAAGGLDSVIPAHGDYSFPGGWPKGEYARVGFVIYGTDENGEELAFYSLIEF